MSKLALAIREIGVAAAASGTPIGLDAILQALVARGFTDTTMGDVAKALREVRS